MRNYYGMTPKQQDYVEYRSRVIDNWIADRRAQLVTSPEHREQLMVTQLESMSIEETAQFILALYAGKPEARSHLRTMLCRQAQDVAESEATVKNNYGFFDLTA